MNNEREVAIKDLEKQLRRIFSYVQTDESFFQSIVTEYKRYKDYYKSLEDCYSKTLEKYENMITRYSDDLANGYSHTSLESILLEQRIWSFAENNPEQWYLMIEKIGYDDQSANIFTPSGFTFMDNFIHNGIYDDWCLGVAKKGNEIIFFNIDYDNIKENFIKEGYTVDNLRESQIKDLLSELENKIEIQSYKSLKIK